MRAAWLWPRPGAPGVTAGTPPATPRGLFPQTQMRVRAGCGAQGAGCGALPAGRGPAVTRGRGAARARRPAAGRRCRGRGPRPPTCRSRHLPAPARAPRAPLTRSWARPLPRPRLQRGCRCGRTGGARRATILYKDRKARHRAACLAAPGATLGDRRGLWPSAPHAPHRRRRATRRARLQPQL